MTIAHAHIPLRIDAGEYREFPADYIISKATAYLADSLKPGSTLSSPERVRQFLKLQVHGRGREVFGVIFLNSQNQVLDHQEMFQGTLSQTAVYPREILRAALLINASALIFWHNHPSGTADPSMADRLLTSALRDACLTLDVRVLDHWIITDDRTYSFAEHGLI